jgi:hypothetical protein
VIVQLVADLKPSRIVTIHSPLHQINFDGPAERLARAMALYNGYPVRAFIGYRTPGSLGTYAGKERDIPTITFELPRAGPVPVWLPNAWALLAAVNFDATPSQVRTRLFPYRITVEQGVPVPPDEFEAVFDRVLSDPRGWKGSGRVIFQREAYDLALFAVHLVSPAAADRLCSPLRTLGRWNCAIGNRVVINAERWATGVKGWPIEDYRTWVINHEVGHALGLKHESCPGSGKRAPVMMQQSKALHSCLLNIWPLPEELARAR